MSAVIRFQNWWGGESAIRVQARTLKDSEVTTFQGIYGLEFLWGLEGRESQMIIGLGVSAWSPGEPFRQFAMEVCYAQKSVKTPKQLARFMVNGEPQLDIEESGSAQKFLRGTMAETSERGGRKWKRGVSPNTPHHGTGC
jgi:hypothetical protein